MSKKLKRSIRKREVGWAFRHFWIFIAGILVALGVNSLIQEHLDGGNPLLPIMIGIAMILIVLYFYERKLYYFR